MRREERSAPLSLSTHHRGRYENWNTALPVSFERLSAKQHTLRETAMTEIANVTVTIATLDRPVALARCLDALLSGHRLPAEFVIVDQSHDRSAEAIVDQRRQERTSFHYIHQQRRGLSVSRNT